MTALLAAALGFRRGVPADPVREGRAVRTGDGLDPVAGGAVGGVAGGVADGIELADARKRSPRVFGTIRSGSVATLDS